MNLVFCLYVGNNDVNGKAVCAWKPATREFGILGPYQDLLYWEFIREQCRAKPLVEWKLEEASLQDSVTRGNREDEVMGNKINELGG